MSPDVSAHETVDVGIGGIAGVSERVSSKVRLS